MMLKGSTFVIRPIQDSELDAVLEVYRQCEDFLALGPVATASMEMVLADVKHSEEEGGIFCGIYDNTSGVMMGIVDYVRAGFEGDPSAAFLSLLMIGAPYRAHGLGAEVVQVVEQDICSNPQIKLFRSGVQVNNPGAVRFWQRMGFKIISGPKLLPDSTTCYELLKHIS